MTMSKFKNIQSMPAVMLEKLPLKKRIKTSKQECINIFHENDLRFDGKCETCGEKR